MGAGRIALRSLGGHGLILLAVLGVVGMATTSNRGDGPRIGPDDPEHVRACRVCRHRNRYARPRPASAVTYAVARNPWRPGPIALRPRPRP